MEINNILELLEKLPATIREKGAKVETAWLALRQAEHDIAVKRAAKALEAEKGERKRSIPTISNEVTSDPEIIELEAAAILLEGAFRSATLELRAADDMFVAVRKIAGLKDSEMRASGGGL